MRVIAAGTVGAMFVAVISASLPAIKAARLEIVDALAGR
jgi:ABC-type antimicrobial peptide transport system permease subunit